MNNKLFTDQELFWLEQEDASSDNEVFLEANTTITHSKKYDISIRKRCKSKYQRAHDLLIEKQINEFNDIQKKFSQYIDKDLLSTKNNRSKNFKLVKGREFLEKNYDDIKSILKQFDDMDNKNTKDNNNNRDTNNEEKLNYQNNLTNTFNSIIKERRLEHEKQLYNLSKQHLDEQLQIRTAQHNASDKSQEECI